MGVCARGGDSGCFPPQGSQAPVLRFRPPGGQKGVRRCPRHRPGQGGGGREGSWTHLGLRALVTSAASTGYAQTKASPARVQPGIPGPASAVPGPRSIHGRRAQGRTLHPSKVTQSSAAGAARRFCPAAGSGERPAPSLSAPAASAVTVAARASEVFSSFRLAAGRGSASLRRLITPLLCAGWVGGGRADHRARPPAGIRGSPLAGRGHCQEPHQRHKRK